ncbi:MAG: DUF721 domain-containing protein [Proteobacteria bacterium]|nr:DUF721 domain-containing protein [Pseudomonadota bacterium]
MRALGPSVQKLVKPLALKNGFADVRVLSNWSKIVGADMARYIRPLKLSNKVLQVAAADSNWAMQVSYQAPVLIEQINRYFGFQAVTRIQPQQSYFETDEQQPVAVPQPDGAAKVRALARTQDVKDDTLRAALASLGGWVEAAYSVRAAEEVKTA